MTQLLDHKHLIVRAEVANPPQEPEFVKQWLMDLISKIRMQIAKGLPNNPNAYYCDMEGNKGITAVAIIETSHIAIHTWTEVSPALVQLDVYSCADFLPQEVFEHLNVFSPVHIAYKFIDRNNGLIDIK